MEEKKKQGHPKGKENILTLKQADSALRRLQLADFGN